MTGRRGGLVAVAITMSALAACSSSARVVESAQTSHTHSSSAAVLPTPPPTSAPPSPVVDVLPGMPPVTDPANVYSDAGAGMLSPAAQAARPMVYVPHNRSGDVWEIDPVTFAVVDRFPAGTEVQHVVPSYDMRTLYATDDVGNTITPIDPVTGGHGGRIPVLDPYNMYFLPDGRAAVSGGQAPADPGFYDWHTCAAQSRRAGAGPGGAAPPA